MEYICIICYVLIIYYLDISNLEPPIFQPVHEPTDGKAYYKR